MTTTKELAELLDGLPMGKIQAEIIPCRNAQPEAIQFIEASPVLTDTQATALDLYARGFNVIPLQYHKKKAFRLSPFFTSRLHHCGDECRHAGRENITELFTRHNIGVITGRTSGNLLAIDCDTHEAFRKMGDELTARTIPFWAITSHRGGAYLLRVIEGEAASQPKGTCKIKDVEIWGNRRLIVIPPSVHPSGTVYQWATPEPRFQLAPHETIPAVSMKILEWLDVLLDTEARKQWEEPELFNLPQWASALSRRNRESYAGNLSEGIRNNSIFALACDLKGNGRDYHEAERIILDLAARVGTKKSEVIASLKSAYSQEREPARKSAGGLRTWQRAKEFAGMYDWRATFGRRALSLQAVYLACVERARRDGREVFRATVREVAELANVNKETAERCLFNLSEHPDSKFIERVNKDGRHAPGLYKFVGLSVVRTLQLPVVYSVRITDTPKTQAEKDIFGKLGLVAWHVWQELLTTPRPTAGVIAKAMNRPRSSVYDALKKLTAHDLQFVTVAEGIYYGEPKTAASLEYLAACMFNGASKSQARKNGHKLERERRVNRLATNAICRIEGKP